MRVFLSEDLKTSRIDSVSVVLDSEDLKRLREIERGQALGLPVKSGDGIVRVGVSLSATEDRKAKKVRSTRPRTSGLQPAAGE